ncbi:hypothetical protein JZ751_026942, partial [Albula glossodonta]
MNKLTAKVSPSPPTASPTSLSPPVPPDDSLKEGGAVSESERAEGLPDRPAERCGCCVLVGIRRVAWGLVLGGTVALAWTSSTHSAKLVLQKLNAPFFITWFCSTWNLLIFPLYYLGYLVGADQRQWPVTHFKKCSEALGEEGVAFRILLRGSAPFSVLWSLSSYLYLLALCRISASDASAVLCCSQAFLFLLSWIGLRERFMGVRIVAAILSITGIVMMAYADGFHGDSITGVALGVGSASTSALYKVSNIFALFNERFFNGLVNLGSALTYPTFISLGVLLSVPASTAVDVHLTGATQLSQVRLAAAGIIGAGYLLLLLPEHWDESVLRFLGGLWHGGWREDSMAGEETSYEGAASARPKPKPAG